MAKPNPHAKLGEGGRFAAVEEHARESGARNPAAVAAAVGRKKYGEHKMAEMAAHGRKSTHGSGPMESQHLIKGFRTVGGNMPMDYHSINPSASAIPSSVAARPAAPVQHMPPRPRGRMKGVGAVHEGPFSTRES